jgi:hypothetical protein
MVNSEINNSNHRIRMNFSKPLLFLFSFAITMCANADTIISYDFSTNSATQSAGISGTDPDVSATDLSVVNMGSFDGTGISDGDSGWGINSGVFAVSTDGTGTTNYLEFSITANSGTYNVTGVSFDYDINDFGNGVGQWAIRSEVDSYASDLVSASTATNGGTATNNSITGITGRSSTIFRLYIQNPKNNNSVYVDNISVTTVIPEPSSLALMGMALAAGLLMWRRRKV